MKAKKVLSLIIAFSLLVAVGICVALSASAAESELPTVTYVGKRGVLFGADCRSARGSLPQGRSPEENPKTPQNLDKGSRNRVKHIRF